MMSQSTQDQSTQPEVQARWLDVAPRSAYSTDACFVDAHGRILGEVSPAADFGYEAKVEGRRVGRYIDKPAAMRAVEVVADVRCFVGAKTADISGVEMLRQAIREAGFVAVATGNGISLIRREEIVAQAQGSARACSQIRTDMALGETAIVPRVGDAGFAFSDGAAQVPSTGWTVERHGNGWAIYTGRDSHHHGANWGQLSECDESLAKRVERGLNVLSAMDQAAP